jgi:ribosome biogenesis GTPase A
MSTRKKPEFWKSVRTILNSADVMLEILDASHIEETRIPLFEEEVARRKRALIYVINKADLADRKRMEEASHGLHPKVFFSAREHDGIGRLRGMIMAAGTKSGKERPVVGIFGYPNVGKSSVINALKGRRSAGVSKSAGFTRSVKFIRSGNMLIIDSPGVIPHGERDDVKHTIISAKNPDKLKDPISVAEKVIREYAGTVEKHYGVSPHDDFRETIDEIARKKGLLRKGGIPDTHRAAVFILFEVQRGKIKSV